jgi:hypothetical protein
MRSLLIVLLLSAVAGFILIAVSHIGTYVPYRFPLGRYLILYLAGALLIWIPAVYVANRLAVAAEVKDAWKLVFQRCPRWMRYVLYGLSAYAVLVFVRMAIGSRFAVPLGMIRTFEAMAMLSYYTAFAAFYAATQSGVLDGQRR